LLDGNASLPLMALVEQKARKFIENFGISIDDLRDLTTEVLTAFDLD
jgi:hypothetical protein